METAKKILIVDDEVDLTQMVGFQFKAQGYEVRTAGDGLSALEVLKEFHPDLIILDINMPRMGGIEFYSKIYGTNGRPLYPVLVLTARANIKGLFQDLQIDGFMIKPFEIDLLVHEAGLIIKKKSQRAPAAKPGILSPVRKVCIVENNQQVFDKLGQLFLNADYSVMPARSGAVALEKMMRDVPEVALIDLGLTDIAGDVLIHKLSQMTKTMDVKYVLFTSKTAEHDRQVMERIRLKTGIFTFVEYVDLEDVLNATTMVLSGG